MSRGCWDKVYKWVVVVTGAPRLPPVAMFPPGSSAAQREVHGLLRRTCLLSSCIPIYQIAHWTRYLASVTLISLIWVAVRIMQGENTGHRRLPASGSNYCSDQCSPAKAGGGQETDDEHIVRSV